MPWGAVPPVRAGAGLRALIRRERAASGRLLAALDDDPTGSQAVHDVQVVAVPDAAEYRRALAGPAATCFVLTNSRSLAEADARALTAGVAADLFVAAAGSGRPVDLVSRSDSTLRGHVAAELAAIEQAHRDAYQRGYDAVLFAPAYLEAGRVTVGDVHWARVGGRFLPVAETEFARDAAFGYATSDLRDFLVSAGVAGAGPDRVASLGLADIRSGGPDRVAELLAGMPRGALVVVNALDYADLETVALAALRVEATGKALLYRTGPSFVRALDGQDPIPPLTHGQIWPDGYPGGHGLIVVGSHVGQTGAQLAALRARIDPVAFELDVPALLELDGAGRRAEAAQVGARVADALRHRDVLLQSSRVPVTGTDPAASLRIARLVAGATCDAVRAALPGEPAWVLAKGGITAHEVMVQALGVRRATVAGQLLDGMVSVYRTASAHPPMAGRPYVVFAGNVGDRQALADVVTRLRGR